MWAELLYELGEEVNLKKAGAAPPAISTTSQRFMKEKPRKRPRVPPNSATRDSTLYTSLSCSISKYGDVFHTNSCDTSWFA